MSRRSATTNVCKRRHGDHPARFILGAVAVAATLATAGPVNARAQDFESVQFRRNLARLAMEVLVNPDVNGDCLIDEEEARRGAEQTVRNLQKLFETLTQRFDDDGDGRLSKREAQRIDNLFAEAGKSRPRVLDLIDRNRDWNLDDEELEAARSALIRRYQQRNRLILQRCDANGDGKLEGDELEAARAMVEQMQFGRMPRAGRGRERRMNRMNKNWRWKKP